jgi:hypothetical protein
MRSSKLMVFCASFMPAGLLFWESGKIPENKEDWYGRNKEVRAPRL